MVVLHVLSLAYWSIFLPAVIGNLLFLTAVKRNVKLQTAVFILLANEALSDLIALLLSMLVVIDYHFKQRVLYDLYCRTQRTFNEMTFTISCFSLSVVAIERFKSICFAIQYKRRTTKWSLKTCLIIWIVSFLVSSPLLYFYGLLYQKGTLKDKTTVSCDSGELLQKDGVTVYFCIQFFLVYLMPLIVLIYTHSNIIFTLKQNSKTKFQMVSGSISQSKQIAFKEHMRNKKMSKLLTVTTIVFFILFTPFAAYRLIRNFNFKASTSYLFQGVAFMALLISTATNFPITLCISKEFRETVKDLLKIKCKGTSIEMRLATMLSPLPNQPGIPTVNK